MENRIPSKIFRKPTAAFAFYRQIYSFHGTLMKMNPRKFTFTPLDSMTEEKKRKKDEWHRKKIGERTSTVEIQGKDAKSSAKVNGNCNHTYVLLFVFSNSLKLIDPAQKPLDAGAAEASDIVARLATCVLFSAAGFIVVSVSTTEWLAILGVVITSLSSGLGEVTLLSYSHQYPKQVISTWSSGTGGAGVIGSISYAGLKVWLSTENTLLLMLIVPVIQAVTFWLVLVHPANSTIPITKNGIDSQEQIIEVPRKNLRDKLLLVPGLLKYMIPLGLVYLFEYFINQGVYELIEFQGIWLSHAEQYRWLQADYQIGVFISRSSVNLITINKIWIMAVLQFFNVIILMSEAIFYYIPNIWIVFALVLWEGLLGGGAYVNTFYRMSTEIPRADRKISLGIASMADSIGIAMAGWLSMPVHNAICKMPQPARVGST